MESNNNNTEPPKRAHITVRDIYSRFFLVNDFMEHLTRIKPQSKDFFDLQYVVQSKMQNATKTGGKFGQIFMFCVLFRHLLKGNNVPLKFLYGFLYTYWINHFYTLGSYTGAFLQLPSVCELVEAYYETRPFEHNYIQILKKNIQNESEDDAILDLIFSDRTVDNTSTHIENTFFERNKDKYFGKLSLNNDATTAKLKLPYLYHNFKRWSKRVGQWAGYISQ